MSALAPATPDVGGVALHRWPTPPDSDPLGLERGDRRIGGTWDPCPPGQHPRPHMRGRTSNEPAIAADAGAAPSDPRRASR